MEEKDWKWVTPPPLGKMRDFAEEQLAIPFIGIERYPEFVDALDKMGKKMNTLRREMGAEEIPFSYTDIRFIPEKYWKQLLGFVRTSESTLAFWDPLTKKCYIKHEPEKENNRCDQIYTIYIIAHELGHKNMENGWKYSFHLNEGLTDFIAKESLERGVFPSVLTPTEHIEKTQFVQDIYEEDGFQIESEDILIVDPKIGAYLYSRIPQLRLVRKLQETHPKAFKEILRLSFSGDYEGVKQHISQTWGNAFATSLTYPDIPIQSLLSMIQEKE